MDVKKLRKEIELKKQQSFMRRQIEMVLWIVLGFILSARVWFDLSNGTNPYEIFSYRYFDILAGILSVLFPILYGLIFGALPLEGIRASIESRKSELRVNKTKNNTANEYIVNIDQLISKETSSESTEEYLTNLVISSRKLAKSLYSRSGVYLMIGVIIAFSGLVFFYLQTATSIEFSIKTASLSFAEADNGINPANTLITLAPKFGILFFIEFIALFFLKQYKSAMDEFRYYESLQRSREETLAIIKLLNDDKSNIDIFEMIEKTGFRSTSEKLENGQTTELLESKKLSKDETEIFSKILDIVGKK